jgi:hypothetical protein
VLVNRDIGLRLGLEEEIVGVAIRRIIEPRGIVVVVLVYTEIMHVGICVITEIKAEIAR